MRYDAVLLLAGLGQRMGAGGNKVHLLLAGKPVFRYSLELFLADPDCQQVILVGRAEERMRYQSELSDRVVFVTGGPERQDSARLGLAQVRSPYVMIHDGARPLLTMAQLEDLKAQPNSLLAVPVKDTIKQVDQGQVCQTLERSQLYQAQTPQFFETDLLKKVHQEAAEKAYLGTDDASLVEVFSEQSVTIVPGSYSNLKLTTPEDMAFAKTILKTMKENGKL